MDEPQVIEAAATPYLYVERSCAMDPDAVGEAMRSAFREVWDWMQAAGVTPAGPTIALYSEVGGQRASFRAGFVVAADDAAKADADVRGDLTPAGSVLRAVHVGPYATLGETYERLETLLARGGRKMESPVWELYVSDPDRTPAAELRTEIFIPTR